MNCTTANNDHFVESRTHVESRTVQLNLISFWFSGCYGYQFMFPLPRHLEIIILAAITMNLKFKFSGNFKIMENKHIWPSSEIFQEYFVNNSTYQLKMWYRCLYE